MEGLSAEEVVKRYKKWLAQVMAVFPQYEKDIEAEVRKIKIK